MTLSSLSGLPYLAHPRAFVVLAALLAALLLPGCRQQKNEPPKLDASGVTIQRQEGELPSEFGGGMPSFGAPTEKSKEDGNKLSDSVPEPAQRFLAVRQHLIVEVPPEQLGDAWASVRDLCETLRCEVQAASLLRETPQQPGNAMLEVRLAPADVGKLFDGLTGVAKLISQHITSDDKTAEVVDVEARIKNRVEFRDSLRVLLRDTVTKRTMADLLEIQRRLTEAQAELDANAAQRKVLEQQTSKQHILIQFTPSRALVQGSQSYSPTMQVLREAGDAFAESVRALILFVASKLPWLLLFLMVTVSLRWLVRVFRRRGQTKIS
ncbi:DUF4349 domain-containing protein [Variovorax paradoxus]|uniref:DUF4349 domain-containing protein n=1 Tax=Variovorax paradoxus TaxID=34073 RepID=UPI003D648FAB